MRKKTPTAKAKIILCFSCPNLLLFSILLIITINAFISQVNSLKNENIIISPNQKIEKLKTQNYKSNFQDFVPIRNLNFDIRENNLNMHKPIFMGKYESQAKELTCNSNMPLQISLILSDRIYNNIAMDNNISPMNSICCFKANYDCSVLYTDLNSLEADMMAVIRYYNQNGAQIYGNFPYTFDYSTGKFPDCAWFTNEIVYFETRKVTLMKLEYNDFERIKSVIFSKGSLLAAFYPDISFISDYNQGGIFTPNQQKPKLTYYLLRLIGWRTLNGKQYWVFGFTMDTEWGISQYGMMEVGVGDLVFYDIILEK